MYGSSAAKSAHAPAPALNGEWTSFANDGGAQYSPVGQISTANVRQLKLAWVQHSGDFTVGGGFKGTSLEVTPIFANGRVYYCTPMDRVFALDPATGKPVWIYDPFAKTSDSGPIVGKGPRIGVCRGVAYWQSSAAQTRPGLPCAKRIFRADQGARLFAIDADTGRACRDFGPRQHPGFVSSYDFDNFGPGIAAVTSAPTVIGDVVIIGGVASDGVQDANDGVVRAFDVRTGALRWSFDPIPAAYRHRTGAANVWAWISADPKNNLVFLPTTSPSTDYYGGQRRFNMPLTSAIVALNATTGAVVWHYQTVHHDLWDYDMPNHPVLVTIQKDGRPRDVAIAVTKTGHVFVLDRLTGQPVFPVDEVPVAASPLPDDTASPTQPIPRLPAPIALTHVTRRDMFGIVGLDKLWCQIAFDHSRYTGLFTPPGLDPYIELPSTLGGSNWGGAAFDPASNSLIVKASNVGTRLHLLRQGPHDVPLARSDFMSRPLEGPYGIRGGWFLSPLGIPCTPPPFGELTSISMDTGAVRWRIPLGQSRRYGVTAPAFLNWGSPNIGGPIATGGGLVFTAATLDSLIRALDANTGRELWRAKLPAPGLATPMTFMSHGRQYVLIAAGGSAIAETRQGDAILAYALPQQ